MREHLAEHSAGHLADEQLICLVRGTPAGPGPRHHLDGCPGCRARLADWRAIGRATRDLESAPDLVPPSFDALLGARLTADPADAPAVTPVRPVTPARPPVPWRLAWQLARTEAALLPRLWAPLSALGLVAAALVAPLLGAERLGQRLFGAACVLLVLLASLVVASPRRDPRRELHFALPVSPGTVFLARLAVVLGADLALAAVSSALVGGPGWWPVVTDWLGEALLASSLALALAVRVAPAAGAAAGGSLWLLGVLTGPQGFLTSPVGAALGPLLSTTPWTVAASALLIAWATTAMRGHPSRT
ncbi:MULTISPECIES: anti-sigma factor family protein [unclassified Streptomyces]|uniref:anti-sigma factor family protein n=1 Tax=unclassified Streptomyces TaxID=2593676 RepID=UPI00093CC80F|nr:hypothetical protein [Streptomyces sp. TSRI0107]